MTIRLAAEMDQIVLVEGRVRVCGRGAVHAAGLSHRRARGRVFWWRGVFEHVYGAVVPSGLPGTGGELMKCGGDRRC